MGNFKHSFNRFYGPLKDKPESLFEISSQETKNVTSLEKENINPSSSSNRNSDPVLESQETTLTTGQNLLSLKEVIVSEKTDVAIATNAKANSNIPGEKLKETRNIQKKVVHIDLKGSPPKLDYLLYIMKLSKTFGADGFLIEYEDMFPWDGKLKKLRCQNAYSVDNIKSITEMAKKLDMIIIPLVQTFGHMEFVLKHPEFAKLRRNPIDEKSICPIQSGSIALIKEMIDQIIFLHPDSEWFHVGGDEVYGLGTCISCPEHVMSSTDLYIHHMTRVFNHLALRKTSSGGKINAIIWEDMIRSWPVKMLKRFQNLTTVMVWRYLPDIETGFPYDMWDRYKDVFSPIWVASAFKGAEQQNSDYVNPNPRIKNHMNWVKKMRDLKKKGVNIGGIVLTGWSRYDHRLPLCETLPAGIPVMALLLSATDIGDIKSVVQNVSRDLGFRNNFLEGGKFLIQYHSENTTFSGADVYSFIAEFDKTLGSVRNARLNRDLKDRKQIYSNNKKILENMKQRLPELFKKYFFDDMIDEWIKMKIDVNIRYVEDQLQYTIHLENQLNQFKKLNKTS